MIRFAIYIRVLIAFLTKIKQPPHSKDLGSYLLANFTFLQCFNSHCKNSKKEFQTFIWLAIATQLRVQLAIKKQKSCFRKRSTDKNRSMKNMWEKSHHFFALWQKSSFFGGIDFAKTLIVLHFISADKRVLSSYTFLFTFSFNAFREK